MSAARTHTPVTRVALALLAVAFLLAGAAGGASAGSARVDKRPPTKPTNVWVSSATPSAVSLTWDRSRDNVGVQGYTVYLSGSVVATSSQPGATISGLGCGRAYTFGVDAYDAAGNHSRRAWATVATAACPDQQAPSAPTGFRQQAASQNDVVLAWDPSTDNLGVVGYGVYRNGLLQTSTAAPTVTLSGLVCGSVYEVAIDAVDAAGNRSQTRSTWVKTAACSDAQSPEKPILSLGSATETSLVLNWQPGVDNVGVDHYNVLLNGVKVAQTTGLTWTYTGLACDTDYALGLEAEDAAGNKSTQATFAPVRTSACSPPPPTADTTAPSQPGSLAVAAATNASVTLAWTASTDNVGVAGYGVYVNGANVQTKTQPGATVSGLACGTAYTLAVDAYDVAGNRSTKASLVGTTTPCADTQAPSTPTNVAVTSRTATSIALSWSASADNVGVVGYGLYQGATRIGTTAVTTGIFSNLACGSAFTLGVDTYDAAGNRSGKATITASTTACPDTTSPSMPTGLSTSNVTGTSLTLGWNASTDNVGVTGYDVYRNGAKIGSVTGTSSSQTGLACGTSYAFAVVSYDAAGNRSSQAQLTAPTAACAAAAPPPPPPPSGTANLWVDPSGGSCARQSSPSGYADTQACGSLNAAYQRASTGDLILVKSGTYGDQTIASRGLGSVTIRPAPGETVTVDGSIVLNSANLILEGGGTTGTNEADRLLVQGEGAPASGTAIDLGNDYITVEDVHTRNFFLWDGADNGTLRYSEVGPSDYGGNGNLCGDLVSSGGVSGPVIEYNLVHDNKSDGCGGAHIDAFDVNFTNGVIRGNRIWSCGTQCVFTGDPGSMLIEHNMIEETNACGSGCAAPGELAVMGDVEVRWNTIEGSIGFGVETSRPGDANVHHNVFLSLQGACDDLTGVVVVDYTSNVWVSPGNSCATQNNSKACTPRFADGSLYVNADRQANYALNPSDSCTAGYGASIPSL